MRPLLTQIIATILLTGICLNAQWHDRLYSFAELTDEMRARIDTDSDPLQADRYHDLLGPDASYDDGSLQQLSVESGLWARGILDEAKDPPEGTAVQNVSWARIKASLSE